MSGNCFGTVFKVTTFGESHGEFIGLVIDGVPSRIPLDIQSIQDQLDRRRPGFTDLSTRRKEADRVVVASGLMEGETTGTPLCMVIANTDSRSEDYEYLREVFRPGHADYTWQKKYGIRDWRGGGRASGRETAARVAAGAVARQVMRPLGVEILGHSLEIGGITARAFDYGTIEQNEVRCADAARVAERIEAIETARRDGYSVGGLVEVRANGVPSGWGEPVFDKLDARLAQGLMSIGAVKGVEVGDGFTLTRMRGSEANDEITPDGFASNHAGGILGGVSNGEEIVARVAVKPTPSILKPQCTVDAAGNPTVVSIAGRHDPCIVPRLVPVAEAMVALVLVDAYLMQQARAV